jgi:hypothetical protein
VLAQITVGPTTSPTLNNGGWVYNAAILLAALGLIVGLLVVFGYMRFAPRFRSDEGERRSVRAPRLQPGREVRRPVNVTGAPVVVEPPTIAAPAPAPAAVAAPPPAAPAPAAAAAPPAAAAAPPAAAAAPPAAAAPAAAASAAPASAPAPAAAASAPTPAGGVTAPAEGGTPSPAPAAQAAAPAAAPAAEHKEISLDQETFDATLADLLAKGTDRRVAEGQARRAAMIAARKKAGA